MSVVNQRLSIQGRGKGGGNRCRRPSASSVGEVALRSLVKSSAARIFTGGIQFIAVRCEQRSTSEGAHGERVVLLIPRYKVGKTEVVLHHEHGVGLDETQRERGVRQQFVEFSASSDQPIPML